MADLSLFLFLSLQSVAIILGIELTSLGRLPPSQSACAGLFSAPPGEANSHVPHLHVASSESSNANTWFQLGALDMCYVPLPTYMKNLGDDIFLRPSNQCLAQGLVYAWRPMKTCTNTLCLCQVERLWPWVETTEF